MSIGFIFFYYFFSVITVKLVSGVLAVVSVSLRGIDMDKAKHSAVAVASRSKGPI